MWGWQLALLFATHSSSQPRRRDDDSSLNLPAAKRAVRVRPSVSFKFQEEGSGGAAHRCFERIRVCLYLCRNKRGWFFERGVVVVVVFPLCKVRPQTSLCLVCTQANKRRQPDSAHVGTLSPSRLISLHHEKEKREEKVPFSPRQWLFRY